MSNRRNPPAWFGNSARVTRAVGFCLVCLAGLGGLGTIAFAAPGPCTGPPQDRPAECNDDPGSGGEVTLDITYQFGTLTGGACTAPACVATSITATGTVECGNLYCDFFSTSVVDLFGLPPGLRDLLFATAWRGTPIDPDQCFGSSDTIAGAALIDNTKIFLRRWHDEETDWRGSVDAVAWDVEGLQVRDYVFNFQGCADPSTGCGSFAPGSMAGVYSGGSLIRIDGKGPDRKFLSVPCRCTMSSTPDCPNDVPLPTPPIRITVTEVP